MEGILVLFLILFGIALIIAFVSGADFEIVLDITIGAVLVTVLLILLIRWLLKIGKNKTDTNKSDKKNEDLGETKSSSSNTAYIPQHYESTATTPQKVDLFKKPEERTKETVASSILKPKNLPKPTTNNTQIEEDNQTVVYKGGENSKNTRPSFRPLVTEKTLRGYVPERTFSKAWDYYKWGYATYVTMSNNIVSGTVKGHNGNAYSVWAKIQNGEIVSHGCDCLAHENYPGPCKHVIALVLQANTMNLKETDRPKKTVSNDAFSDDKIKSKKTVRSKVLKCPECGAFFPSGVSCCPECGYPTKLIKEK
jgi:hypothetical protein